jgi:hypothetical protein
MREHIKEGAARQAIVIADLLRRDFEVWQEVGPASVDLIASKHTILLRVEVKGEKHAPTSNLPVFSMRDRGGTRNSQSIRWFDVMAIVEKNSVRYSRSGLHTLNSASKELVGEESIPGPTTIKSMKHALTLMLGQEESALYKEYTIKVKADEDYNNKLEAKRIRWKASKGIQR